MTSVSQTGKTGITPPTNASSCRTRFGCHGGNMLLAFPPIGRRLNLPVRSHHGALPFEVLVHAKDGTGNSL
jgi:hypothetical protein